jgi:hypothetical protein
MQQATAIFNEANDHIARIYDMKAAIAPDLCAAVREIAETGHNPENTLGDILKLARLLDISTPNHRSGPSSFTDPRYNLVDYIKRSSGAAAIREINADEILFNKNRPFTCVSQIQEIFEDVAAKLDRNFTTTNAEQQYA